MKTISFCFSTSGLLLYFLLMAGMGTALGQTQTIFSGNWSDGSNWNNGVPGNSSNADVYHAMTLNSNISIGYRKQLLVHSGGSITDPNGSNKRKLTFATETFFDVDGNVTVEGDFDVGYRSTIVVRSYDTLIVGDAGFAAEINLTIEEFGVMIINGDFDIGYRGNIIVNGNLYVNGEIETGTEVTMSGTGRLETTDEVDLSWKSTFFGNGSGCSSPPCSYGSGGGLPVELLSFSGNYTDEGAVQLEWITGSEINSDYFTIEVSTDGFMFDEIGRIKSAGNSIVQNRYKLVVPAEKVTAYYRLTEIAINGSRKTYPAIVMEAKKQTFNKVSLYPNPTKGNDYVTFDGLKTQVDGLIELRDMSGKLHFSEVIKSNEMQIPVRNLKSGLYFLFIKTSAETSIEKLIIN